MFLALWGLLQDAGFAWLYFWPWRNKFEVDLVVFCRLTSIYIFGELEVGANVWLYEIADVEIGVPLLLVGVTLASLFLPPRVGLQ